MGHYSFEWCFFLDSSLGTVIRSYVQVPLFVVILLIFLLVIYAFSFTFLSSAQMAMLSSLTQCKLSSISVAIIIIIIIISLFLFRRERGRGGVRHCSCIYTVTQQQKFTSYIHLIVKLRTVNYFFRYTLWRSSCLLSFLLL